LECAWARHSGSTTIENTDRQFGTKTDAMKERIKATIPMGRMGKPEEISAAAVFLASEESSFVTGIDLLRAALPS